jgi:hypothetical protein
MPHHASAVGILVTLSRDIDAKMQRAYFPPLDALRTTDGRRPHKPQENGCMGHFLKGWRRKFGVVALFLALAFTGGWVKSSTDQTVVCVSNGDLTDNLPIAGKIGVCWSSGNEELPGVQVEITGLYCDLTLPEPKQSENEPTLKLPTDLPGVTVDLGVVTTVSDEDRSKLQGQVVHVDKLNSPEAIERLTTSRWQRGGFYVNRTSSGDGRWQTSVFIPHWSIVIPLTLLAAVLLIKPRPRLDNPAPSGP